MRAFLLLFLLLAACAPKKEVREAAAPVLTLESIPAGCEPYLQPTGALSIGSHEFGPGDIRIATAFDCGIREGKQCYFYLHVSAGGAPTTDTRCEVPL